MLLWLLPGMAVAMIMTFPDARTGESMRYCRYLLLLLACLLPLPGMASDAAGAADSAIYEVPVAAGVSYEDVVLSLKVLAEGENFVNPANFPLGEHLKARGQDPGGPLEVHAICNLSLGAEIMLDHPEFAVFAPCRIAIYQKQSRLYLGLDRPTYDLRSIRNPTPRAQKAAQTLEDTLIDIMQRASRGEF